MSVQELASSSETITHPLAARSLDFEVSDIALMRGYVQGLELRDLADRYIEPGLDLRLVKAKLLEVRSSLQAVARRKGDARLAALLGRDR